MYCRTSKVLLIGLNVNKQKISVTEKGQGETHTPSTGTGIKRSTTMVPGSGDPFADLTREHGQLKMKFEILVSQKERLKLKVKHQAVQITRLESSRRTLRESNKTLRESLERYKNYPNAW